MSRTLIVYVAAVGAVATTLLALYVPSNQQDLWGHYLGWMVVCALSESIWLRVLSGEATSTMGSTA